MVEEKKIGVSPGFALPGVSLPEYRHISQSYNLAWICHGHAVSIWKSNGKHRGRF